MVWFTLLRRIVVLITLCAFASPCWAHNMAITVKRARNQPNLIYDGTVSMSLIAIIEVNGVRVGLEQVSWEVSPNDDGLRLLWFNTTEGYGTVKRIMLNLCMKISPFFQTFSSEMRACLTTQH